MRLGVYLADQEWDRTQSKGIYAYSRVLVRQLAERLPEHELTLVVNRANRSDMVPRGHPEARVVCLPTACASGIPRIVADHVLAVQLARTHKLDLFHFPKGFVPLWATGHTRVTATVHDTIPLYYQLHYPGYFARGKLRYFRAMIRHALRRTHALMTDSRFSRTSLLDLARTWNLAVPAIDVCEPAPDPSLTDAEEPDATRDPNRLLHLGSLLPHKRTRDTLALFQRFNRRAGGRWRLHVSGLHAAPSAWNLDPRVDDVHFLGPLAAPALRDELRHSRALLLLSSIEGFGLPALEAWFLGTPVCYAMAGSVGEILAELPGRCEPVDDVRFDAALQEVLDLPDSERLAIRDALRKRFGLDSFGSRVATIFRRWLGSDTSAHAGHSSGLS